MPRRIAVCTSFDDEGYRVYGRRFVLSFLANSDLPLHVFYGGKKPEIKGPIYHDLHRDAGLRKFRGQWGNSPFANGVVKRADDMNHDMLAVSVEYIDYRFQAIKFANKVYAVTGAVAKNQDWWVWIDADVEVTKTLDDKLWDAVCRDGIIASYLGRKDWHHSECGFVAYHMPAARSFLNQLRFIYDSGLLFLFQEWHDSFIWDAVRKVSEMTGGKFNNLSAGVSGTDVWPQTILGEYMVHHKGPVAKRAAYGSAV